MSLYLGTLLCCLCVSLCAVHVSFGFFKTAKCDQDPCADCPQKKDLDIPENDWSSRHAEQKQTNFLFCTPKKRVYRPINGTGNNKKHPAWGSANSSTRRLFPASFDDKINFLRRKDKNGNPLSSARTISSVVHPPQVYLSNMSVVTVAFAQFGSHDIARFQPGKSSGNCCDEDANSTKQAENGGSCFPIIFDRKDKFYVNQTCKNQVRDVPVPGTTPPEHYNALTTAMDLSTVYGSSEETTKKLRGKNGTLITAGNNMLPNVSGTCITDLPGEPCLTAEQVNVVSVNQGHWTPSNHKYCAVQSSVDQKLLTSVAVSTNSVAPGHPAVNQWPGVTSQHLVWFRLHNLITENLSEMNPGWDSDKLFEEARSITIGAYQHIFYNGFLPVILNDETLVKYKLKSKQCVYDENVDIRAIQEFVGVCYRFGHSIVPNEIHVGEEAIPLASVFNSPDLVITRPDEVIAGLATYPAESSDNFFAPAISQRLFERNATARDGADLVSTNIQRGRDHAYPTYNEARKACGLKPISDFDTDVFRKGHKLGCVYKNVDDIDFYTGAVTEVPLKGSAVGPTCAHVIGEMFYSLKCGDRFFYHVPPPEGFTNEQREVIESFTMTKVLCLTTNIQKLQENAFYTPHPLENPRICCSSHEKLDLSPWKEKCFGWK